MKVFFNSKPQKGCIKSPPLPLNLKRCQKLPLQWAQTQPGSHKDSHRSAHTEQKVYSFFLCSSDSGWQGEAVFLHESCQSGNRAGLGPQQCYGRVSAYGFIVCVFMCLNRCVCVVNICVCVFIGRIQGGVSSLETKPATGSRWRLCSTQRVQSAAARVRWHHESCNMSKRLCLFHTDGWFVWIHTAVVK